MFTYCDNCNKIINRNDSYSTYNEKEYLITVCKDCLSKFTKTCKECNDQIDIYKKNEYFITHSQQYVCLNCFTYRYFVCDGCQQIYRNTQMAGSNEDGCFCEYCFARYYGNRHVKHKDEVDPQNEQQISQYDYGTKIKPKLKKKLSQQQTKQFIGIQLQLQNSNENAQETTEFINQVSKNKKLICKSDGSLNNSYGVQINTFPCTYNYHLKSFGWQNVFNIINEYNMTDISNSGLHFHISKDNFSTDEIKSLDYFVNHCTKTLGNIGGRDYSNNQYCKSVPNKKNSSQV